VIVPPHIRGDLLHHLDTYVGEDPTVQLFPAVRGCHLNDRVFRDYLAPALKAIGHEDMRIHDLRHFAGTQARASRQLAGDDGTAGPLHAESQPYLSGDCERTGRRGRRCVVRVGEAKERRSS
jgi:integrase